MRATDEAVADLFLRSPNVAYVGDRVCWHGAARVAALRPDRADLALPGQRWSATLRWGELRVVRARTAALIAEAKQCRS